MQDSEVEYELRRARDRIHALEKAVWGNTQLLRDVTKRIGEIEPKVDGLELRQEIAEAVADKLHERRGDLFTWWQKGAAGCVAVITVSASIKVFLGG